MEPVIRYEAAILRNEHVLLLKVWDHAGSGSTFWVVPGGGRLPGESEEECVKREVQEETHLEVEVERLISNESNIFDGMYGRRKTYACRIISGEPRPGIEPEIDTPDCSTIQEVGWFDLRDPHTWDPLALSDPITMWNLGRIRRGLGYEA